MSRDCKSVTRTANSGYLFAAQSTAAGSRSDSPTASHDPHRRHHQRRFQSAHPRPSSTRQQHVAGHHSTSNSPTARSRRAPPSWPPTAASSVQSRQRWLQVLNEGLAIAITDTVMTPVDLVEDHHVGSSPCRLTATALNGAMSSPTAPASGQARHV